MAHWGGGISVVLHRGSNCPLSRAMDGRIMRRGIISSCQSVATSEIVKRCCSSLCKQRYSKYSDLYLYLYQYELNPRMVTTWLRPYCIFSSIFEFDCTYTTIFFHCVFGLYNKPFREIYSLSLSLEKSILAITRMVQLPATATIEYVAACCIT